MFVIQVEPIEGLSKEITAISRSLVNKHRTFSDNKRLIIQVMHFLIHVHDVNILYVDIS